MKRKILGAGLLLLFALSAFSTTIRGSRTGANDKTPGFFVEAFSAKGRVLFKSLKFDTAGNFVLDFPATEALVYWIDNFPVYAKAGEHVELVLPERKSGAFVIGGGGSEPVAAPVMLTETHIKQVGNSTINNLLINDINTSWTDFIKKSKGQPDVLAFDQLYAAQLEVIAAIQDQHLKEIASFYNNMRYMEVKLQYLRTKPSEKVAQSYFQVVNAISLNNPAVNSLKSIGLRSLVANYYQFLQLSKGVSIQDEDLTDNGSLDKMNFLLKNVSNERIINEELNQAIVYHLSIKGWNPQLDGLMNDAITKTTDAIARQNLIDWREKYSKVSKNTVAPDFSIPDATGKMVKLSDFKGKIVAIDVWATWCIPCMHSLPYFLKLRDKYQDNKEVVFVSISTDNAASKEKWLNFLKSKKMTGVDLHAGDKNASAFEKAYNITGIPRYILIDRSGKIIEDHAVQASEPGFEALIQTALQAQ